MNKESISAKAICFCADRNYLKYVVPAIESITKAEPGANFEFHVITDLKLEAGLREKFLEVVGSERSLVWHNIDENKFLGLKEVAYFTKAMYYRLLIPALIPHGKVLYLDCDILVRKPFSNIFTTNLEGKYVAAVINPFFNRPEIVIPEDYFNSGVMLINCEMWRRDGIADKVVRVVEEKSALIRMPDQDALNIVIAGRWERLGWTYNSQMSVYLKGKKLGFFPEEAKDPAIVHFSATNKQWHKSCGLIFAGEYLKLKYSIVEFKRNYLFDCMSRIFYVFRYGSFWSKSSYFRFKI